MINIIDAFKILLLDQFDHIEYFGLFQLFLVIIKEKLHIKMV
jgi:hypothetical protein